MTKLHAQPYDMSASGFYFESLDEFNEKAGKLRNGYGQPVEEFEIQLIDGDRIDGQLFEALSVHQGNFGDFLDAANDWTEDQKTKAIIAIGEAGYSFKLGNDDPDDIDVDLYECESLRDLAVQFIDDGLFGDIPENIRAYLDYDAIAHDLSMDYSEITIDGTHYIYRCA